MNGGDALLRLCALHAFYGKSHILHGVDLDVGAGEIVSLLGRNGSGRTTVARAIMGLVDGRGSIRFRGEELLGRRTFEIALRGIGYVPESRDVFPTLSVEQNLGLGVKPGPAPAGGWRAEDVYRLFPQLAARRQVPAGVLSGGEQQMLALGRTLLGNPALMVIDEPTEGLAPLLVAQVADFLAALRQRGVAVLLIEQKLVIAPELSDRLYVMGHGRVVFGGTPAELAVADGVRGAWLAV